MYKIKTGTNLDPFITLCSFFWNVLQKCWIKTLYCCQNQMTWKRIGPKKKLDWDIPNRILFCITGDLPEAMVSLISRWNCKTWASWWSKDTASDWPFLYLSMSFWGETFALTGTYNCQHMEKKKKTKQINNKIKQWNLWSEMLLNSHWRGSFKVVGCLKDLSPDVVFEFLVRFCAKQAPLGTGKGLPAGIILQLYCREESNNMWSKLSVVHIT